MRAISLQAKAKINLSLDVTGKRPDGYHEVNMIVQTIALHDNIRLESIDTGVEIFCDSSLVPEGRGNIAYRAAELLINRYDIKKGIRIKINKNIPVAAGLAGGSSNAAAVLNGMNGLFSLALSRDELMILGKKLGADVPFCIIGGTALAKGIGDILTGLDPLPRTYIVLVKPQISVSTEWAYRNLDLDKISERPDTDLLLQAIKEKNIYIVAKNMGNVLETVTAERYGIIREIKDRLLELGAAGSMMSGSGPAVFGIFAKSDIALQAYNTVKDSGWECFLTYTD